MQVTRKMLYWKKEKKRKKKKKQWRYNKLSSFTPYCSYSLITKSNNLFFSLYFSFKKKKNHSLNIQSHFSFSISSLQFSLFLTDESWWCWIVIFEPPWWIVVLGHTVGDRGFWVIVVLDFNDSHHGWLWFVGHGVSVGHIDSVGNCVLEEVMWVGLVAMCCG